MNETAIRSTIKDIIASVAGLDQQRIGDEALLRDDLDLDSLSLLEIAVEVELAFHMQLPDERYRDVASLPQMVALVSHHLRETAAAEAGRGR